MAINYEYVNILGAFIARDDYDPEDTTYGKGVTKQEALEDLYDQMWENFATSENRLRKERDEARRELIGARTKALQEAEAFIKLVRGMAEFVGDDEDCRIYRDIVKRYAEQARKLLKEIPNG